MAKQSSGSEGKAPLVVATVIFVLSTLVLGWFFYDATEKLTAAQGDQTKAQADKKTAEDSLTKEREAKLLYKGALGILNEQDRTDLQAIRFKEDARKAHSELMTAVNQQVQQGIDGEKAKFTGKGALNIRETDVFRWDWAPTADFPPAPQTRGLIGVAVSNFSGRELAMIEVAAEKKNVESQRAILKDLADKTSAQEAQFKAKSAAFPQQVADKQAEEAKKFEDYKKGFQDLTAEQRKQLQEKEQTIGEKQGIIRGKDERLVRQGGLIDKQQEQLDAKIDPFQFDKYQGKILRRVGQLVEIDLGSADNLRPGLTFSVMPSDTPSRGFESRVREIRDPNGQLVKRIVPKGGIEVIEILGANLAQCRISDEESQVRDRILTGDLIYNPIWRKGSSEHIVLYGIFDLDGDGRDDIVALAKELTKMGVIVDAYWDLNTNKWVGEVSSLTTFAVEGFSPTVGLSDGNKDGKIRVIGGISDARSKAKEKGVRILRPRDFFPRIGYKAKLDLSEDTINQAATYYIRTIGSAEAAGETPKN